MGFSDAKLKGMERWKVAYDWSTCKRNWDKHFSQLHSHWSAKTELHKFPSYITGIQEKYVDVKIRDFFLRRKILIICNDPHPI